jgi:CxxC motif-containing protein (DUF1111 family)
MKKLFIICSVSLLVTLLSRCHKAELAPDTAYDDRLSGGKATSFDESSHALTNSIDGMNARDERVHELGDQAFEVKFVAPPATVFGGLGSIFNNVSCINCHRNDGGGFPSAGTATSGLLMRISQDGTDPHGGPVAVDGYGTQIQDQSVLGYNAEAKVLISYTEIPFTYPDGSHASLRKPEYSLQTPYLPIQVPYTLSPRLAPPLIGIGLIDNIPEETIRGFVDAGDKNGDGISGKVNMVYDPYLGETAVGRFGLKANTSSLLLQVANAYQQDMGVSSYVNPNESSYGQQQWPSETDNGKPELADSILKFTTFYVRTLAVPARRDVNDPDVQAGSILFNQINCSGCHRPTIMTGPDFNLPQLSGQRIHPYTDVLLHDMGDGLSDNRPDFLATGREWRTQPLWGLGLLQKTTGIAFYLHDGRARTIEEAILWHDGEAAKSKQAFTGLTLQERQQLMKFLNSL